ncbi:unnamed protein product [Chilo suppressalis]|uniref:MANSC domain-containing protein n=1 Tax=Chilo suppressalis TaxID=168631 RepID=A0ABN8L518_CHISP|nr:unnamed protein product [Chilo suppressalis]
MFRFIVALLIINSYSGSSGAPTKNVSLSFLLNDLANKCSSSFLSTQMENRLGDCHVSVPPYQKKQLECLLFYDINRQLCEAVASSKLNLNEDYTSKILAEQDGTQLCAASKDWTFTNISEVYNKTVNAVFHDPAKCFKFCVLDSDNVLSVDTTFYCKYFKWGSNMLKSQLSITNPENNADIVVHIPNENVSIKNNSDTSSKPDIDTENDLPSNHDSTNTIKILQPNVASSKSDSITSTNKVNSEIVVTPNKLEQNTVHVKQNDVSEVTDGDKEHNISIPSVNTGTLMNGLKPPLDARLLAHKEKTTSTISPVENNNKKIETGKDGTSQDVINQIENRPAIDNGDPDDYPANDNDSEEVRDGLGDTHVDEDPDDTLDTAKIEQIVNKKELKMDEQKIDNNDLLPKESYSNTIPDFAEEDDHFFPFFLTAIIMVVLLYILYHNKNRVSKVVLGLIVEGRQPGRRRNSRGHAYRRLDTLEQAMSTNTAAPPSKIIY